MSEQNPSSSKTPRIEIRLRNNGMLEAGTGLKPGQALAPYLVNRRGAIRLHEVHWRETGRFVDHLTLLEHEIVWARPLDARVPVTNVGLTPGGTMPQVAVVLTTGQTLEGRFALIRGQGISDFLGTAGPFPVLRDARLADGRRLGDVVVSLSALRSVREIDAGGAEAWEQNGVGVGDGVGAGEVVGGIGGAGGAGMAGGIGATIDVGVVGGAGVAGGAGGDVGPETGGVSAVGGPVHWLLAMAQRCGGCTEGSLALPPATPALDVWWALCATGRMDQNVIARMIAQQLRLPLASDVTADRAAQAAIPTGLARRYAVRALSDDGRHLLVATIDPMDANAEQALSFACKRRVGFAVATPDWLGLNAVSSDPETELESLLAKLPSLTTDLVQIEEDQDPKGVTAGEVSSEPIIKLCNLILREAVRQNASDVHLEPDAGRGLIRFRVDGVLRPYMHVPLAALSRVISRFKILGRLDIADRVRPQDGRVRVRIDNRALDLRLSTVPTQDAEKAVIRIAGAVQEQRLDQLEVPEPELAGLRHLLGHRDGIIIVTGPTGSGKTTTLYAALSELNTGRVNIMTVEDPIERALAGATQIQVDARRGVTFASALRAVLRQDPDVILVGEIRDLETAEIAVQAATTGHLVLATLHTTTAVGVIERLRDLGVDRTSLAGSLRGVVGQRLARRICGECGGDGCMRCEDSGYRGRIPIMEVLTATSAFAELVGRGASFHELQRAALAQGMRTMHDVAAQRVAEGLTTGAEINRVIGAPGEESAVRRGGGAAALVDAHMIASDGTIEAQVIELTADDVLSDAPLLSAPIETAAPLPALRVDAGAGRGDAVRLLLQGLDRCVAEGQQIDDVLAFACSRLSAVFDSPLVWTALREGSELSVRARAGACSPWFSDVVPDAKDLTGTASVVGMALRTGTPQGCHSAQDDVDPVWRESARLHNVHIFLAIPMNAGAGCVGVVGVHVRDMDRLDPQAGAELVNVVERIGAAVRRLHDLHAASLHLAAFEHAADAVFTTDRHGIVQWVNQSFTELSGYSASEIIGLPVKLLRSDRHDTAFYRDLWDTVLAGRAWRGELFNMRRDGGCYAVEQTITPLVDGNGVVTHFLAIQRDITERKQREDKVRQMVTVDPLTRLPNGRALEAELARSIGAVAGGAPEGALLLIRIDGAGALRASMGPEVADARVVQVAAALTHTLRPGDFLARLGDDEFAALLPATPVDGAHIVVDRVTEAIAGWTFADEPGHIAPPTANVGTAPPAVNIGVAPVDGTQAARAVIALADAALYDSHGRDGGMVGKVGESTAPGHEAGDEEWARRIRRGLDDDQFVLHFQPVVRLRTGAVSHYDALIRLHDDHGDVIPARAFITHAENLGLMPRIDQWVLENVLRLLRTAPELRVSMNLSAATVTSPQFRQFLQRKRRCMSAVGARLIFEVAEVAAARDLPRMLTNMQQLSELGCRFALDNFGIRAASVTCLGVLPVDYVKLDGTLVGGVDDDDARAELVRALVTVARALGKEVIAACAERQSTLELLPLLGIDLAQGHCLGRPTPELARDGRSFMTAQRQDAGDTHVDTWFPVPSLVTSTRARETMVA